MLGGALLRPSFSVLGWAAAGLLQAFLLAALLQQFPTGGNPRLRRRLPGLGLAALGAVGLHTLVLPAEVLFWVRSDAYPWWQAGAAASVVVSVVLSVRRRRPPDAPPPAAAVPLVERVRATVTSRLAVLTRYAATAAVVLLAGAAQLALAGWAFVEGWIALVVALVLVAEVRTHRWSREDVRTGFAEPDPWAGRTLDDTWWGLASAGVLVLTLRTTAAMGGLRPEPWWWYAVLAGLAVAASVLPFRLLAARSFAVFGWWLRRRPRRYAELVSLRDAWPRSRTREFGVLPEL